MRIKAGVHVVPGIAQTLKGQIIIMRRMEVAMEGQREARRQAGHVPLPGVSAPLSVCALSLSLLFQQTSSFSSSGEALWEIQNESDSSFAFLPSSFFPSSRPCVCPASLSLCLSALALLCLPVSVTPSAGLCARLSLSLPASLPPPLSHSLLCLIILIIVSLRLSPGCLAVATPHEVTTLSHTHTFGCQRSACQTPDPFSAGPKLPSATGKPFLVLFLFLEGNGEEAPWVCSLGQGSLGAGAQTRSRGLTFSMGASGEDTSSYCPTQPFLACLLPPPKSASTECASWKASSRVPRSGLLHF